MFNFMPGSGLAGGGLLAFGLAPVVVVVIIPDTHPAVHHGGEGGGGFFSPGYTKRETWVDEGLRAQIRADLIRQKILRDDQEIMDLIVIIVKSGIL